MLSPGIIKHNWKLLVTICSPIILSAIPLLWTSESGGKEPYAAYVILLMAVFWMTECIPIPVTAFTPIILYPLFGILATDQVTSAYLQDSILFLFGGCILALSFEYSNLHSRLALKVILLIGANIPQLLFGIMFTTMFLSMWMNNTSTTAMMVPIIQAITIELQKEMESKAKSEHFGQSSNENEVQMVALRGNESSATLEVRDIEESEIENMQTLEEKNKKIKSEIRNLGIMFLLGIAYASNIGGTGIITGSASNVIALDLVRKDSEDPATSVACKDFLRISFLDWMVFNIPPMIINTTLTWVYLQIHFIGFPPFLRFWAKNKTVKTSQQEKSCSSVETRVKEAIRTKYNELGSLKGHEIGVLIMFVIMILLWIFKDPKIFPGWDSLPIFIQGSKGKSYIKEATPTFLIVVLLCVIPSKSVYYTQIFSGGLAEGLKDPLLSWKFVYRKFPWGLFMLLGGGTAMAVGAKESGLNKWIGIQLESSPLLRECPDLILLGIVLVLVTIMTTIASNTATAAIVTPVLLGLAYAKEIHPLYLVMAGTTVCSYAFMLPVSTPPNAIAYSSSTEINLPDMALPGLVINIFCILTLLLTTSTTSSWFFHFSRYNNECSRLR